MRRLRLFVLASLAGMLLIAMAGLVRFEVHVMSPLLDKARSALAEAQSSERDPPEALREMLGRLPEDRLRGAVVRKLLRAQPDQTEAMDTLQRQFTEVGVWLMLPLHLSKAEMMSIYLCRSDMGSNIQGFARAAEQHLGVRLERVDRLQAARLMVIARAPSYYLNSPEWLERNEQQLLQGPHALDMHASP